MAVLKLHKNASLPVMYEYRPEMPGFRTIEVGSLGNGILSGAVIHVGADTPGDRDAFLLKVLAHLGVSRMEAARGVWHAEHLLASEYMEGTTEPRASASGVERDGTHLRPVGLWLGLLLGGAVGYQVGGWHGLVLGVFAGFTTLIDLVVHGWQLVHIRNSWSAVDVHDALAGTMVTAGSIAGAVVGLLIGRTGFERAAWMFLGMGLAALVASWVATLFSPESLRAWSPRFILPLVTGGCTWALHALWSSPVALALGVLVGSYVSLFVARRMGAELREMPRL
ncbi:hypothetical protein ACFYWU_33705 [Streptomyces chrestomyceticus]|uniref:hypothetical protein n=1 Tax=Streptomyces chrestomyceticus TaxID=68185 RepID=UPI0036A2CF99